MYAPSRLQTENMKGILTLIVFTTTLLTYGQEPIVALVEVPRKVEESITINENICQTTVTVPNKLKFHTRYEYTDPDSNDLIIENGYPKGAPKYTGSNGKEYGYVVFWTRITNETNKPFDLAIEFHEDSYELPSLPGLFFKPFIPSDTMTIDNESLLDFGLDLKTFLDNNFYKPAVLNRTIEPNDSSGFFIVILANAKESTEQFTLRAGLSIKGKKLFYRINDREIRCGKINLKKLKLQK